MLIIIAFQGIAFFEAAGAGWLPKKAPGALNTNAGTSEVPDARAQRRRKNLTLI
jgi:hypothetical protein